jgi:capsular polysaccharide transport system permease protein
MNAPLKTFPGSAKLAQIIPMGKSDDKPGQKKKGFLARLKKRWIRASAMVCIAVPTLIASIYLGLIASDRFAVEVKFAVRGQETAAIDALGIIGLAGGSGTSISGDSYILVDYIRSRGMWDEVSKAVDLRKLYAASGIDWFSRLDPAVSIERTIEYWKSMTQVSYEPATGIISVEVSAYNRDDAVKISQVVTSVAEALINRLSTESRRDALKAANSEVERAEQRQRMLRATTQKFREKEQISDPVRAAGFQQEMIEKTKAELQSIDTELQAVRGFMKDDAPSIVVLKNKRAAVLGKLAALEKEVSGKAADGSDKPGGNTIASMLSNYEEIQAERVFAEKAYLTALASLERARFEADRKQRYLAIFEKAETPDEALYPKRLRGIAVTFVGASLLWGLLVLMVLGVREHV